MLSVLICSNDIFYQNQVRENIKNTIGVPYEILCFDNRLEKKGICYVYNELASKASFPHLCFVHEDVLFRTQGWGKHILDSFAEDSNIGVIGVAGSKYKSKTFSGWYTGYREFDCANILHLDRNGGATQLIFLANDSHNKIEEVVSIDGVFISCRKEIWEQVRFDDDQLKGFHFYDIDFSLRAAQHCSVMVTYEIDMVHITTGGDFGNNWVDTAIAYHQSNNDKLPYTKLRSVPHDIEIRIANTWLDRLKTVKISWAKKVKWIRLQKLYRHSKSYYSILKFLLYKPLGLKYIHRLFKRK